mgnify:CR=1 FL=1
MIYSIKGSRQVKETEARCLLRADSSDKAVDKRQECSFSGMVLSIGRLKRVEERVRREMISEARFDNTFSKFGEKGKIGDRTIIGEVLFIKRRFFEKRVDHRVFESCGKDARFK